MQQIEIGENESGQRLDKFLQRFLPAASPGFLYKMLRRKNITVNQKKCDGRYLLCKGDQITIYFSDETFAKFQTDPGKQGTHSDVECQSICLEPHMILFENDQLMLINKPAGTLSQKSKNTDTSITEMVDSYLLQQKKRTEQDMLLYRPGPANRLDRNTSGLMVFPLTLAAARNLSVLFKDRKIDKTYLALVKGDFTGKKHLKNWFSRDSENYVSKVFQEKQPDTVPAEIICQPIDNGCGYTLLEITLLTGKTHQIRAQMQANGYPLAGDRKYGKIGCDLLKRQFLHSWSLTFPQMDGVLHSLSGCSFQAPLPNDLNKALGKLGISLANSIKKDE